jgi:hypothetical protein
MARPMTQQDPWSGAGGRTREEVREIFARHVAAPRPIEEQASPRRAPLPTVLGLPGRLWRLLPPLGKVAAGLMLAAAVALAVALVPPALDNAGENRENERRAIAANRERIRRNLVEEQRPRRAALALPANATAGEVAARVEPLVAGDARERVAAGDLNGPIGATSCEPVHRQPRRAVFVVVTCLAERGTQRGVYRGRALVSGFRFRARVELATGAVAWCKENPRPLHGDQEEFVVVPVSRACTG